MDKLVKIDPKKTTDRIVNFLKTEFKDRKKKVAILGMSGGIDSVTCAFLCKKADLKLYAVNLPYKKQSVKDSLLIEKNLSLPQKQILTINIGSSVDAQVKELKKNTDIDMFDKGNIMARQRMIVQYALAKKLNGLVVGTENLSEYWLAYFTTHGDGAYDIAPIANLLKTQVYEIAKYLGVPEKIIKSAPSAGLWKNQTDENELGFSYFDADPIIHLYKVRGFSKQKIIKNYSFDKNLVEKVIERIDATQFKREYPPKCVINQK